MFFSFGVLSVCSLYILFADVSEGIISEPALIASFLYRADYAVCFRNGTYTIVKVSLQKEMKSITEVGR